MAPTWPPFGHLNVLRVSVAKLSSRLSVLGPVVQLELSKIASEIAQHATGDRRNGARAATDKCGETAATTTSLVLGEVWYEAVIG